MKVGFTPLQPFVPTIKNEKDVEVKETKETFNPKEDIKEIVQNYIEELQKAQNEKGEDNPKVQRLIGKFKFGKKLTPQEIAYIRKHAPGMMDYVHRIMRKRELMERSMKIAPTKYHVHMVAFQSTSFIEKEPSQEDRITLFHHLKDAKREYEKTDEFKEKPTGPLEMGEKTTRKNIGKKNHNMYQ